MKGTGRYTQVEHTADAGIDAEAPDEAGLYEICAVAMFEILTGEGCAIEPSGSRSLRVEAAGRDLLLMAWLRELLHLHGSEGWIFASFEVVTGGTEGAFWIEGRAAGERIDPSRHSIETEIKAVTYHQLAVSRGSDGLWKARVIFDI